MAGFIRIGIVAARAPGVTDDYVEVDYSPTADARIVQTLSTLASRPRPNKTAIRQQISLLVSDLGGSDVSGRTDEWFVAVVQSMAVDLDAVESGLVRSLTEVLNA